MDQHGFEGVGPSITSREKILFLKAIFHLNIPLTPWLLLHSPGFHNQNPQQTTYLPRLLIPPPLPQESSKP